MKKNEIHVSKLVTAMPKLKMSHSSRLVLYTVLKKVWQNFRNSDNYRPKYLLLPADIEEATKPVILKLADLRVLFKGHATFKDIKEHILEIPYEARFKTNIDLHGKKVNELMDVKMSLFYKVLVKDSKKEFTFLPSPCLIEYLECLKSFAIIDIEELKKLQGHYQIRGYELICQNNYLNSSNNKLVDDEARKIKIEDIRRYFCIPTGYNVSDIDKRVLNPLKRAINKHTKYNIVGIKKFKLDSNDKKRVTHYRIDVEYKDEYIEKLKEIKKEIPMSEEVIDIIDNN